MQQQDEPTPEKILKSFLEWTDKCVDEDGYGLSKCTFWDRTKRVINAAILDLPVAEPGGLFWEMINTVDTGVTDYFIAGVDMTSAPDQGLEFDDFVWVLEFDRRRPEPFLSSQWRHGVINYKVKGERIIRPIDWENAYWKAAGVRMMKSYGPPFRAIIKKG